MASVDVEVKGLIELQRKMEQMVKDVHGEPILNAMRDSTLYIERKARLNAPIDTGRLRASIVPTINVLGAGETLQGIVGTNVVYAPDVEFGTKPHGIFTRKAFGTLAFNWENGPNGPGMYFFRSVTHPGTKGKYYMTRAFNDSKNNIERRFNRALAEIINK